MSFKRCLPLVGGLAGVALLASVSTGAAEAAGTSRGGSFGAISAARGALIYGGATAQDGPFGLVVSHGGSRLARLHLYVTGRCANGQTVVYTGFARFTAVLPAVIDEGDNVLAGRRVGRGGKLRASGRSVAGYGGELVGLIREQLRGRLRGDGIASGTLRVRWELQDRRTHAAVTTCDSGNLRWVAESAPGRVFAGLTSAGQPVVVELTRDAASVARFRVGWSVDCRPSGGWILGDRLERFPIRRGRFGRSLQQPYQRDGGGVNTFRYKLHGRLRGPQASGSLTVAVRETDAAGSTIFDCGPSSVRWTAASTVGRLAVQRPRRARERWRGKVLPSGSEVGLAAGVVREGGYP